MRKIVPEAFTEGKIDFDKLKNTLGDIVDSNDEKYTLNWAGRSNTFKHIQTPSIGTLIPDKKESVNFDDTKNIFIEGENLEVLKLLQKSYFGKIKCIYIDPPYNTGQDFIYKDNFYENTKSYLEQTGQTKDGIKLTTNPETSGRFHSDWISFMYARLFMARNLLSDDGVIFVSIDDREIHNLKFIMNEIFGEENFVISFVWRKTDNQANIGNVANVKEYILCYAKNKKNHFFNKINLTEKALNEYGYEDNKGKFRRAILLDKTRGRNKYSVKSPNGNIFTGPWMIKEEKFKKLEKNNGIHWTKNKSGNGQPYGKIYLKDSKGMIPNDLLISRCGSNQEASNEITRLFGKRVFDFPKPTSLIEYLIKLIPGINTIILDFFAGSGTTAQAALELNKKDGGNRRFILIQAPEKNRNTDNKEYSTIADISIERIRRAIKQIKENNQQKLNVKSNHDLGFKVFKLAKSNYKIWENYNGKDEKILKEQIKLFESPLIEKYKDKDVIYECIIKEGYSLNSIIEKINNKSNTVYKITDDEKSFYICLDKVIHNIIEETKITSNDILICIDKALGDSKKINLSKQCILKTL